MSQKNRTRIRVTKYLSGKKKRGHKSCTILFLKTQFKLPLALQYMKAEKMFHLK